MTAHCRTSSRLTLAAVACIVCGGPARAGTCGASDIRYSTSSNRVYISDGAECTLSDIAAYEPGADIELVDADDQVWFLGSHITVEEGATLLLYGSDAGGDVDELRMKSNDSSSGWVEIRAWWGNIDIKNTKITSWDESTGGPDTKPSSYGRAYIRALSYMDGSTPRESRMDIADSDIGYLGYNTSEGYGLSWKVRGSGVFDELEVYGDVTGNTIHDNYYGAYTYGAYGMEFSDNVFEDNVVYGLDPHDDSDGLVVEGNTFQDNGSHGFICSKRCDNLVIRNNVATNNEKHGFMLHSNVTDSLVEYNTASYNGDGGISIYDSHDNTVQYNTLIGNARGIRMSVGSSGNLIYGNTIESCTDAGIDVYKGSDEPSINDGMPQDNTIQDNDISGCPYGIKLTSSKENTIEGNSIEDVTSYGIRVSSSTDNVFEDNDFDDSTYGYHYATSSSDNTIIDTDVIEARAADTGSVWDIVYSDGKIAEVNTTLYAAVSTTESVATLKGSSTTSVRSFEARDLWVDPADGALSVQIKTWEDDGAAVSRSWYVKSDATASSVTFVVGDLTPGTSYTLYANSAYSRTLTADDNGQVSFTATSVSGKTYKLVP